MKLEIEDLSTEFKGRPPAIHIVLEKPATETDDAEVDFTVDGFDRVEAYIIMAEVIDACYEKLTVRELEEVEEYFADEE